MKDRTPGDDARVLFRLGITLTVIGVITSPLWFGLKMDWPPGVVAPVLLGLGIVLLVGGLGLQILIQESRDAAFKRRWYPWSRALLVACMLYWPSLLGSLESPPRGQMIPVLCFLLFFGGFLSLLVYWDVRRALFCDACGTTILGEGQRIITARGVRADWRYCCECGTKMKPIPPRAGSFWTRERPAKRRSICPECSLRYPEGLRLWKFRPRHCPECGANLADARRASKAAKKKGAHDDLTGTDWNFPAQNPRDAKKKGEHDDLLDP